jgi:hypothetical protein
MSPRRGTGAVLAVAVTAPLAAGVAYAARSGQDTAEPPAAVVTTGTVAVRRGTLIDRIQVSGTLGYTGSWTIGHQGAPGVLTAAAVPGTTVGRDGVLYRVADAPVRLLLGAVPAYRDLGYGMSDGPDVRQLEQNLVAMGHDPRHRITVDRHFSAATAAAIRRWEASWGRPAHRRTGRLARGVVVFQPSPVRITTLGTRIGAPVDPGATVLAGTSAGRAVTAELDTTQAGVVRVGDQVEVRIPDNDPIKGRIAGIGQVATQPPGEDPADPSQPPPDPDLATVPVTITIPLPRGFSLQQAPVSVDITTGTHPGVLLVPISALLARDGGGYQVRLAGGTTTPVEPGRFDESTGQVEIVSGLTEGQSVEVPAT